jgi:hypothetical protein
MLSTRRKLFVLFLGMSLAAVTDFALTFVPGFSEWSINATSARQILGDIAKISGTMLALFTTVLLFFAREKEYRRVLRETFTLSLFVLMYAFLVGLIFMPFWTILNLESETILVSSFFGVFLLLFVVLCMLALFAVLVYVEFDV